MRGCLWEGPLSLRAPKSLQLLRNTILGEAAFVSKAHSPVCADQAASAPGLFILGLEFVCSSLFSNRKRGSDQKGQGFPKPAAQSSPEQPWQEAKGQSVNHSKSLAWEGSWG